MNWALNPESHHSLEKRLDRFRALSATVIPPALSDVLATTTVMAISRPRESTIPNVLRPEIFFPAS